MDIGIGSVVYCKGFEETKYVITGLINRENMGSCAYDRTYRVLKLEDIIAYSECGEDKLRTDKEMRGIDIDVTGTTLPFVKVEDEAPFAIKELKMYSIRRKTPVQVTAYE